ncbi:MAG: molybdopterin-dependent oxidoreductase [Anaerolineae bacterium]|jgi:CO/xanthine dehydrogenase Mo-binding subunit|nr:molybdopterin-dependent oxidoreductase [Anaerolineae bacterium]
MKGNAVGRALPRFEAKEKVTGEALYPGDLGYDGALTMKLLFAGRPHARVVFVDTAAAEGLPGVEAVFTSLDVPVNEYGLQYPDQPVLCGPSAPGSGADASAISGLPKVGADVVRWVGDQVAAVVAVDEDTAARAVSLIRVVYEDLPLLTDPREALQPEAVLLHPPYPGVPQHPELVFQGNLVSHHRIRRGDVDAALLQAEVVVESTYEIPGQEHAYLQPEAGLAYLDEEGRITVVVAGQWAHEDQAQVAHALGVSADQVRIIYPAIGGAFGGREDMSVQIVLALAVQRLRKPVKIVWSRTESILGHHKRHRLFARARWAAAKDGTLLAAECEVVADAGAYVCTTNKVMGNVLLTVNGPYRIPNVRTDVKAAYTNNTPGGAFRGFGAPQGNFIAESQMDKLAEALGMDPVDLRLRNLVSEDDPMPWGKPLSDGALGSVALGSARGLRECLISVAEAVGWQQQETTVGTGASEPVEIGRLGQTQPRPCGSPWVGEGRSRGGVVEGGADRRNGVYLRRGVGIALAFKNVGYSFGYQDNAWACVELHGATELERVVAYAASADVGQGTRTVIRQMVAEALSVPVDRVELRSVDTAWTKSAGSASASRMTYMIGNAIRGAAAAALHKWREEERPAKAEFIYLAPQTTQIDAETGYGHPNFAYGYAAIAIEVVVDLQTGLCTYPRIVCANDVGQAINPKLVEGQVEGGVVQALGWATTENFVEVGGVPQTRTFSTYLMPTIEDIPGRVQTILIENPEPRGPWGARGMGEMPFIAVASALHNALRRATGVWYNAFPFNSERILSGLKGRMIGKDL